MDHKRKYEDDGEDSGPSPKRQYAEDKSSNDQADKNGMPAKLSLADAVAAKAQVAALAAKAQIQARLKAQGLSMNTTQQTAPTPAVSGIGTDTIVLHCPKTVVGLVIGRGGDTIKMMQEQSGANIQIDQNVPAGLPCKITVSGNISAVAHAKALIEEKVGVTEGNPQEQERVTEIMDVPHRYVGKVIGRGGETIKSLIGESGADISLDQDYPDGAPRKLTIKGTRSQVDKAAKLVTDLMESRGVTSIPAGGSQVVLDVDPQLVGKVIGRGGETIRNLQATSGAHITIDQNFPPGQPRKVTVSGQSDAVETACQMLRELLNQGGAQVVLNFDSRMTGKLIGRGGETIKGMQNMTGARIQIDQQTWKITISGSDDKVEHARQVVQNILDGGDPPNFAAGSGSSSFAQGSQAFAYNPYSQDEGYSAQGQSSNQDQNQWGAYYQPQGYYQQAGYDYYQQQPAAAAAAAPAKTRRTDDDDAPPGIDDQQEKSSKIWEMLHDEQGRPYYWNHATATSQWEKPAGLRP